jgi:hypothetical protein
VTMTGRRDICSSASESGMERRLLSPLPRRGLDRSSFAIAIPFALAVKTELFHVEPVARG